MAEAENTDEIDVIEITARHYGEGEDATEATKEKSLTPENYYYPSSIYSSTDKFPNRIIFRAYRQEGVNIASLVGAGINKLMQLTKDAFDEANPDNEALDDIFKQQNSPNSEQDEGAPAKPSIAQKIAAQTRDLLEFRVGDGTTSYDKGGKTAVGSVTLPLPRDLRYADIMEYSTANLGVIGAGLESALKGNNPFAGVSLMDGNLGRATSAIGAQIVGRVGGSIAAGAIGGTLAGVPGAFLGALAAGDVGEGIEGAFKSATKITAAPNSKTLFNNVGIRNFSFTFKMIAYDPDEAKQIKEIVKFFRREMYPEIITVGSSGVPLAYKFPSVFEIDIKNKNDVNPAFKIALCYLRDVQVAFNSTAVGMYSDGNFIETDIVLSFVEIEALHRGKIREGY